MTRTTLFIPCSKEHVHYIPGLLHYIAKTDIFGLSEILVDMSGKLDTIMNVNLFYFFAMHGVLLKVYDSGLKWKAQKCNNLKSMDIAGDIVMIQDADDTPHPMRLECVRRVFEERRDVDLVNHGFWTKGDVENVGLSKIEEITSAKLKALKTMEPDVLYGYVRDNPDCVYGQNAGYNVGDGFMAFRKSILEKYSWPTGEQYGNDGRFCKAVTLGERRSLIIDAPVYFHLTDKAVG